MKTEDQKTLTSDVQPRTTLGRSLAPAIQYGRQNWARHIPFAGARLS